jgi:glycogen phosphorylase
VRALRRFTVRPVLPEALAPLSQLSTNLRWTWHQPTKELFRRIDPAAWAATGGDPVALLGESSTMRLGELARDEDFLGEMRRLVADLHTYLHEPRWFDGVHGDKPRGIAYFSPEFGLDATLPQYSGGLGILAGDHLKAASDLGVPLIGVGLLYRHGYFRQLLSADGWQQERYPVADPDSMAIMVLREADGTPAKVQLELPGGRTLAAAVWVAHVGRIPLLMLDSGVEENDPADREVTDRLYGGNHEHRLMQELLLGIGGVRAVRAWCRITGTTAPEVFHTNEGHAGFLGVERIREYMADGLDYASAVEVTRAGTVFTTHTPVPAGIDRFPRDLVSSYLSAAAAAAQTGMPTNALLALGREDYEGGDPGVFNMAVMGLRLGARANGVSLLHGQVSREMFSGLWPGFDVSEVPITSVTNGVHGPTWMAPALLEIVGDDILSLPVGGQLLPSAKLAGASDEQIWGLRRRLREELVVTARQRLYESWITRGATPAELSWVHNALDPDVLTLGFARRVPSYKRLTLMLRDQDRLRRLLTDPDRPVQIVIAGKSHPADDGGKALIQQLVRFADRADVRHRIVFLPDYDMRLATPLVAGADVWLNNPLRPYEACGTSGMKSALNGGLNLSIRDGWWDEWFDGNNGWAIPSAEGIADSDRRDDVEATAMYDLIEQHVAPRFYDRDGSGIPQRWLEMVRSTWRSIGEKAQATRMVAEYTDRLYTPAAVGSRRLNANFAGAKELAVWKARVRAGWQGVDVEHVESQHVDASVELGTEVQVTAYVRLGDLTPDDVDIAALTGGVDDTDTLHDLQSHSLKLSEQLGDQRYRFSGPVPVDRTGQFGYTVRAVPSHVWLTGPADMGLSATARD